MVSRCFPGGYNVKLYISRGRLAWWLLAFLHSVSSTFLGLGAHLNSAIIWDSLFFSAHLKNSHFWPVADLSQGTQMGKYGMYFVLSSNSGNTVVHGNLLLIILQVLLTKTIPRKRHYLPTCSHSNACRSTEAMVECFISKPWLGANH